MLLVVAGVVFFQVRTDELGSLELQKATLILVQQNFHKVLNLSDTLKDIENIELFVDSVFTLLIEQKLTLTGCSSQKWPLSEY